MTNVTRSTLVSNVSLTLVAVLIASTNVSVRFRARNNNSFVIPNLKGRYGVLSAFNTFIRVWMDLYLSYLGSSPYFQYDLKFNDCLYCVSRCERWTLYSKRFGHGWSLNNRIWISWLLSQTTAILIVNLPRLVIPSFKLIGNDHYVRWHSKRRI